MTQIIDNTGIFESTSNGARLQTLLLKIDNELYQISIKCESHARQSYATLNIMTPDKKWTQLKSIQPQREYQIDISYSSRYSQDAFLPIIKDFLKLIASLHGTNENNLLKLL
jgi:hypothetical protein